MICYLAASEFLIIESIVSGIVVASAFLIGALIAVYADYSKESRAIFATFGAGIFLAATAFLVQETLTLGNNWNLIVGFIVGAVVYYFAEQLIKKRSKLTNSKRQKQEQNSSQNGSMGRLIIIGTILDSVPETLFVGIIIAIHEPGLAAAVLALFLGNLGATLEGAKIMQLEGIESLKILRDWLIDFVIVAVSAPIGYFLATVVATDYLSIVLSFAAGALIVFVAGELISPSYRESKSHYEDISISIGFLIGAVLLFVL